MTIRYKVEHVEDLLVRNSRRSRSTKSIFDSFLKINFVQSTILVLHYIYTLYVPTTAETLRASCGQHFLTVITTNADCGH